MSKRKPKVTKAVAAIEADRIKAEADDIAFIDNAFNGPGRREDIVLDDGRVIHTTVRRLGR